MGFIHKVLSLLALILQLTSKLIVLDDGELSGPDLILLVIVEHVHFNGFNVQ